MRAPAVILLAVILAACGPAPPSSALPAGAFPSTDPCESIPTPTAYANPILPAPRIGAAPAYDAVSQRVIMFSGVRGDDSCPLAAYWTYQDTWAWDGHSWAQLQEPVSPPGRSFGAFAFDPSRQTAVLFGGGSSDAGAQSADPPRADTWLWDGSGWEAAQPDTSPSGPAGPAIYYRSLGGVIALTDRPWQWTGQSWKELPGHLPAGVIQYAVADDPHLHQVVLFGSFSRSNSIAYETWTWSGSTWQQQYAGPAPSGSDAVYMVYDCAHKKVFMFDGATYTWNGSRWTELHPTIWPRHRLYASMTFDAANGEVVLFGGRIVDRDAAGQFFSEVTNELWTWDGTSWHQEH